MCCCYQRIEESNAGTGKLNTIILEILRTAFGALLNFIHRFATSLVLVPLIDSFLSCYTLFHFIARAAETNYPPFYVKIVLNEVLRGHYNSFNLSTTGCLDSCNCDCRMGTNMRTCRYPQGIKTVAKNIAVGAK